MQQISPVSDELYGRMVELRRHLHRHPEPSWAEEGTATIVEQRLAKLGLECRRIAGTGLIADIAGVDDGPAIALRADMDALPVHEETGLDFSSERPGWMHACGHDGHIAMLVGAAELLLQGPPPPRPVRLIFQPAEELGEGALKCIEAGALDGVGMIFGGHVDRHYPPATLVITDGSVNASTDSFELDIRGRQGHGARPHESLDAIVVGSLLVTALQTIVSREVDPAHPSVVSVGVFQAGTATNVIAGRALLAGTIRAQSHAVRTHLIESIERVASAVAKLHDARIGVTMSGGTPSLINLPEMTKLARRAALEVVPEESILELHTANMGGEDFAYFLEQVPGCYVRFGAQLPGRESFPAHSSRFEWSEDALGVGASWLSTIARMAGDDLRRAN